MAGKLQFVVEVTSDQGTKTLQAISHGLEEMGVKAKNIGLLAKPAREAGKEMGGLAGAMMAFKREQVQQGRLVGFYVRELTEFTGMGEEAKSMVSGLGQVLVEGAAGGLSFGLALEAVKFAAGVVAEEVKRAGVETQLLNEAEQAAHGVWLTGISILEERRRKETEAGKAAREAAEKLVPEIAKAQEAYDKLRESGPGAFAWIKTGFGDSSGLDSWNFKLSQIADAIERAVRNAATMKEIVGSVGWGDAGARTISPEESRRANEAVSKTIDETKRKAKEAAAKRLEEAKLRASAGAPYTDSETAGMLYNAKSMESDNFGVPAAYIDPYELGLAKARAKPGEAYAASEDANMIMGADQDAQSLVKAEHEAAQLKTTTEQFKAAGAAVSDIFGNLGTVFGKSAGQMGAAIGKLIQQAIQLGIAMSASAGPFGWLQVAAAAAAIMATVASVPEFKAAGGSVSAGRPYIVGELGPELFVPGQSGSIVPNNKMGGGTTIVINATDPKSFSDYLERNAGVVIDRLNTWTRDRRI